MTTLPSNFKPLLAEAVKDTSSLKFPVLVSPKLDGIRAIVENGVVLSRSLKPIRNRHVQFLFGREEYNGLDGELIVGSPTAEDCYQVTNSGVMSESGKPDVRFYVFDRWDTPELKYLDRYEQGLLEMPDGYGVVIVDQVEARDERELLAFEAETLEAGYEGVMVRSLDGFYKFGRSTVKEGILLKLKRFVDNEYKVVGYTERMHNANEATKDKLGHTERSTHKENLIPRGDLGALVLELSPGVTFNCGSGFTDAQRETLWSVRETLPGRYAKVKSFAIGVKDLPRFPIFLGFRDKDDM